MLNILINGIRKIDHRALKEKSLEEEWSINTQSAFYGLTFNIYYYSKLEPATSGLYWHYVNDEIAKW